MLNFSLPTFLKICSLDTGTAIGEIQKKANGNKGYDFYHTLYRAIRLYALTKDEEDCRAELAQVTSESERNHNSSSFDNFLEKFGDTRSLAPVSPPYSSANMVLKPATNVTIKVDPLFCIESRGNHQIYCVYAMKNPILTQKYGAVGCYIQRTLFQNTSLANGTFCIFDSVSKKVFSERQITNMTAQIFKSDVRRISGDINDAES